MVPTLFGIMLINFVIVQAAPGGPVEQTDRADRGRRGRRHRAGRPATGGDSQRRRAAAGGGDGQPYAAPRGSSRS